MRILIAQVNRAALTNTFIAAHAAGLGPDVAVTWGYLGNLIGEPRVPRALATLTDTSLRFLRRERASLGWARRCADLAYRSVIHRFSPDVVLAESGPMAVRVAAACRRAGVPLVAHFHGQDASLRSTLAQYADEYRTLFARAAAVIAVSRDMMGRLEGLGAPREKLVLNPCGVDLERFTSGRPPAAPPTFLAVGRFVEKKAPDLTVRAFAIAHRQRPEARLRMIGEGPLLPHCRRLALRLGIADAVAFLGPQPHDAVAAEMRGARAFVQHSVVARSGDAEGTPVAILEAGATGLPVVATRHAGILDAVVDGSTGFLVEEGDVEGMAARFVQLVDDPNLAGEMGRAAREQIASSYSLERSIARLRAVLEAAADGRALPRGSVC